MPTRNFAPVLLRVIGAGVLLLAIACRSPSADAYIAEQLRTLGDELNASRQQEAQMQTELDSLRNVVARQDTLLKRLADMAGLPR